MKRALITGGCGFVGRHFLQKLLDDGWYCVCIDNLESSGSYRPKNHPNLDLDLLNVRDFFKMDVSRQKYHLIIHLAAIIGGRLSIDNSPLDVAEDLAIDADFFKWIVNLPEKPDKVVYFSSSAAYPISYQQNDNNKKNLSENMIDFSKNNLGLPDMTYGMSKLVGEYLARIAHEKYNINIVCYRPFSGYGPDQDDKYPFIAIMKRVLKNKNPIQIWSDSVRDFVYIDDIVDCVFQTLDSVNDGSAINIGSGIATSFSELVKTMLDATGTHADIEIVPKKPAGVHYRVADITRLDKLDFKPKTSLIQGIRKVADYLRHI